METRKEAPWERLKIWLGERGQDWDPEEKIKRLYSCMSAGDHSIAGTTLTVLQRRVRFWQDDCQVAPAVVLSRPFLYTPFTEVVARRVCV